MENKSSTPPNQSGNNDQVQYSLHQFQPRLQPLSLYNQEQQLSPLLQNYQQHSPEYDPRYREKQPFDHTNGSYNETGSTSRREILGMVNIEPAMRGLSLGNSHLSTPSNWQNQPFAPVNDGLRSYLVGQADNFGRRTPQHELFAQDPNNMSTSFFNPSGPAYNYDSVARDLCDLNPFAPSTSHASPYNYTNTRSANIASRAPLMNHASASSSYPSDQAYCLPLRHYEASLVEDSRGELFFMATHAAGCRKLRNSFETGSMQEKELILTEIIEHLHELMVDEHGTRLVQRVIEICSVEDINRILFCMLHKEDDTLHVLLDNIGTRAVQKFLERLITPVQQGLMLHYLRPITSSLVNSKNGFQIILTCFARFTPCYLLQGIGIEIFECCIEISKDKYGCIVIQECLGNIIEEIRDLLLHKIIAHALELAEHRYGNFVISYIIGMENHVYTTKIINQLAGNYVYLSQDMYASHVVENCILLSENYQAIRIIKEIMDSRTLLSVLQHSYGNYVAQKSLHYLKNMDKLLFTRIANEILKNRKHLHSHPHGRRVYELVRKIKQQPPHVAYPES